MKKLIIKWLLGADWEEYWELHEKYSNEISCNIKLLDEKLELYNKQIEQSKEMVEILDRDIRIIQDNKSLFEICKANGIEVEKDDYFSLN